MFNRVARVRRPAAILTGRDLKQQFDFLRQQESDRRAREEKMQARRRFWAAWGGWLLFGATMLGLVTALLVIYSTLENLGWFNL